MNIAYNVAPGQVQGLLVAALLAVALCLFGCFSCENMQNVASDTVGEQVDTYVDTPAQEVQVQLPSSAGGSEGIALVIMAPASPGRYPEGAPVAISVPGGWKSGGGTASEDIVARGIVSIGWLMPGSQSPVSKSGGTYDVRGAMTLRALADVTLYAIGELKDSEGLTLHDRVPHAHRQNVGYVAGSNGGNMALAVLGQHAQELSDVAWISAWESPLGDQQANVELNDNPYYLPGQCDATSCALNSDFADALSWNPNATSEARHDASLTVPGRLELQGASPTALSTLPAGLDGDEWRFYFSQELSAILRAKPAMFFGPQGPPVWLELDAEKVAAYWAMRDGSLHIPAVAGAMPSLRIIHIQRQDDHVQQQPDYPHATAHLRGWADANHPFFRLNPDSVYQAHALGADDSGQFPEVPARALVAFPGAREQMVPNPLARQIQLAAIMELVDRTQADNSELDLDALLYRFDEEGPGDPAGALP